MKQFIFQKQEKIWNFIYKYDILRRVFCLPSHTPSNSAAAKQKSRPIYGLSNLTVAFYPTSSTRLNFLYW